MQFDVFLSHSSADDLERIAERLRREGIQPWLDRWRLRGGDDWQQEISQGLRACGACAVFVGPAGLGDWAREELRVAHGRAAKDRAFRLFMVLLPGAPKPDDPSLAFLTSRTWVDLRAGPDDPDAFARLVDAITDRTPHAVVEQRDDVCPYRGLEVFDAAHAEFFFGRDTDIALVVEKLKTSRFLAVLGPSGCGKSSLVRAGMIPALKGGALPGSEGWTVGLVTPGARPLSVLAPQVARLLPQESMLDIRKQLRADEHHLDLAVSLGMAERPAGERMVLVVDQFEEVFTLCADEAERAAFVANLCYAASIPGGRVAVVAAMRADFYHRCAAYPALGALMAARQFLVSPLDQDALREVIERPARQVGLTLEAGLAEAILDDVADRPGSLPLLEHVLWEVWQRRRGRLLTFEAYVASGGVEGALAQRANGVYDGLEPVQREIARRVLLRLVQPGEGSEDTRRRARMDELLTGLAQEADLEAAVKALADGRLLTTGRDEVTGERVVDVAHEALIRGWPRLRAWIEEDRELLRAQRRLTEATGEWDVNEREEAFLYRGARLAAWQDRPLEDLNALERAFLAAGRALEARERAGTRRRVHLTVSGLSITLVIITVLAIWALSSRDLARSRELAASARVQLSRDPELSILLARQALAVRLTPEAEAVLRQAVVDFRVRVTLSGHTGPVWGVAFSPDGQRVASAGNDGTVRVWPAAGDADPTVLSGHTGPVQGVALSPDGQQVVSAGEDGTVRVWPAAGDADPIILSGHTGPVWGVALSPDGQQVVSAGEDGTVRVWPAAGDADPIILFGHIGLVWGVAFSPDGQRLASAGADGTVRIWPARGGADPTVLVGHTDQVLGVAFSPDGQRVVSAGNDGTVRVWPARGGADPTVLSGHTAPVWDVVFSPDGQRLASASFDGTVRVWPVAGGAGPTVLSGHTAPVWDVVFSPDGQRLASASFDGTVRIWQAANGADPVILAGHTGPVFGVALSPDGQRVASGGNDGMVRVWPVAGGADPVVLSGHNGAVRSVAFSPDGQRVASAGADGTVRIWRAAGGADPIVLTGHAGAVRGVAFSPDGQRVASAGDDGLVRVWPARGGADPTVLSGPTGQVYGVAFSPDGQRVVSAGRRRHGADLAGGGRRRPDRPVWPRRPGDRRGVEPGP
ncbi:MAG: TIR domain-containing protein [Egibacteraceae bacterium]